MNDVRHHDGIDFAAPVGHPIRAVLPGRVSKAGREGQAGNLVVLAHSDGRETVYMHLSRLDTAIGACVARGQAIGRVGATGLVAGPHLHFELHVGGQPIDPALLLVDE